MAASTTASKAKPARGRGGKHSVKETSKPKPKLKVNFYSYRSKRYRDRVKAKKEKLVRKVVNAVEIKISKLSPLKRNVELKVNSFVRCRSTEVRKLMTDKPSMAIAI